MADVDVLVVGAGLAGLAAARRLVERGRTVRVLEARQRVGGRLEHGIVPAGADGRDLPGAVVELGGQWIGATQTRMAALVAELGLEVFDHHNDGDLLVELDGRVRRMASHRGAVPPLNPLVVADLAQAQLRLDRLARRVPLEAPWKTPGARALDARSLESWIVANVRTRTARRFLRTALTSVFAAEPSDVSLLHAVFYVRSGTDLDTLLGFDDGAQQQRIVGGSARIAEALAAGLGGRVVLGRAVRRLHQREIDVEVVADGGAPLTARRVVVALPPTLAGRLVVDPPLPAARDQLTQRTPAGSVIKLYAVYPRPFWRSDGLTGTVITDRGPVSLLVDNSPPEGRPGILLGFVEGRAARELTGWTPEQRTQALIDTAVRVLGPAAAEPVASLERDWSAEEFTRGCYGAHFPTGVWTGYGHALRTPVDRVHWAGADTAPVWNGYLEGAVRSGEHAADEAHAALG